MSKYPINLIEVDFVRHRMMYEDIEAKYGISQSTLAYYSKKLDWQNKRKNFRKQVASQVANAEVKQEVKEQKTLIERLEYLRDLKLGIESKVFASKVETNKEIMHLVNKSKDPVGELTKIIELLKGNATDRVEINEKEKALRYNRLRAQMIEN